jgi:hypothetical protein
MRPVPGASPVRGVRPVWKPDRSNASGAPLFGCCGPAGMAGERGPALEELAIRTRRNSIGVGLRPEGEAIDSVGGRMGLGGESRLPPRVRPAEDGADPLVTLFGLTSRTETAEYTGTVRFLSSLGYARGKKRLVLRDVQSPNSRAYATTTLILEASPPFSQ